MNGEATLRSGTATADRSPSVVVSAAEVPAQHALDEQLRAQRLFIIKIYSIGLTIFSFSWCLGFLYLMSPGTPLGPQSLVIHLLVASLIAGGILAYRWCGKGRLKAATYAIVVPLILMATSNLALISNAEGTGFVTFCVAAGVAALVLEGREWLYLAGIFIVFPLMGALLHTFPVVEQIQLPRWLAVAAILAAALGTAYPTALFWLFSTNLTASRTEAWEEARRATEATSLMAAHTIELQRHKSRLEAKNHEMSDFLYVVSHDLRAPLINLEGFSRSLKESVDVLDEILVEPGPRDAGGDATKQNSWPQVRSEIDESLQFILHSVAKMDLLVKGLIELSRIDTRPQISRLVDLNQTVDSVVASLQYLINERGIAIELDPLPTIRGDTVRLNQVFGNLIDNAIKYMKPEGEAKIHIGCRTNGVGDLFFVKDTGVGIRDEDRSKVFRLFTRLAPHASSGEGLGLSAVRKIVENNGGRIWVESEVGRGSTFWFTWPRNGGLEVADDGANRGAHQNLAC
jgi:signal transduction histidine kinase